MPRTQSAKKALRKSGRRRIQNVRRKETAKAVVKEFRKLVLGGNISEAKTCLPRVYKALDKMAKVGIIKQGRADRMKSRLTRTLVASGQTSHPVQK